MRALFHRACLVALVLLATTVPAVSQGMGMVSGQVVNEEGLPIPGTLLTLSGPGIIGMHFATTDADGRYRFRAVSGNHPFTIRAEAAGRVPVEYVGNSARRDDVVTIDFKLRAPGSHEVLVLIEAGIPYHWLALEGALSSMPGRADTLEVTDLGPATVREVRRRIEEKPSAVLAIGDLAARLARRHVRDVPVVYVMVPAPIDSDLTTRNMCGVPLNGGFDRQIERLQRLLPEARRIGTVYDPRHMGSCLAQLRESADAAGIDLIAGPVHGDQTEDLQTALDDLAGEEFDAFLVLLDPRVVDAEGFERIARFAASRNVVLAVPDPSLAQPDRSFSFVPGFWEQGAYAGMLVRRIIEGKVQPSQIGMAYPAGKEMDRLSTRHSSKTPREVLPSGDAITAAVTPEQPPK
jgi:putative ABC transport system substrate-binding protein